MTRLLIAASGTGGHLFPALAVAEALNDAWNVRWLGVPDRLETTLVPERYGLITIRAGGLQGSGPTKVIQLLRLLAAGFTVARLIRRQRIEVVFTTGGYIAAPAILGARLCGVPAVLHEANAIPGRVTRLLGRFCRAVAVGLPVAADHIPGSEPLITGMPVRAAFLEPQPLPLWVPEGGGPLLVVIGGAVIATGRNDPEVGQLEHPLLAERPSVMRQRGCCSTPIWRSAAGAGSLANWRPVPHPRSWFRFRRPTTIRMSTPPALQNLARR